jgi:osmotically-inducible protein OsmY
MNDDRTRRQFLGLSVAAMMAVTLCPASTCRRRPVRTDAEIEEDNRITVEVRRALTDEPAVDAVNITVLTDKRVVSLTGTVGSEEEKQLAKKLAGAVSNVLSVTDNLTIQRR